jgi:plastocyanin
MGWLRGLSLVLALVFVLAAAFQYNDPDPVPWMAIYAAAAAVSAWATLAPATFRAWLAGWVGAIALVWAGWLLPQAWGKVRFAELFQSVQMKTPEVEVAREVCGLLIVAAGMGLAILATRMEPLKRRSVMRGAALVIVAVTLLMGCREESTTAKAPGSAEPIAISLTEAGFVPANVTVAKNQPVTLVVTRKTDEGCAKEFVMKSQGINKPLPLNEPVTITFTPKEGGTLRYACAMDMVSGTVTVE